MYHGSKSRIGLRVYKASTAIGRCCVRLWRGESGGVAILFALFIVPMLFMGGFAVDYTRGASVKYQLQFAADAAVLAARGSGDDAESAARDAAVAFARANAQKLNGATITEVKLTPSSDGMRVDLTALMPATVSKALGIDEIELNASSTAVRASGDVEIALVLDNTGSMAGSMDELKTGALDLVAAVFSSSSNPNKVKMAVVPYVGAVNIGNGPEQRAWMDLNGDASWHGHGIEGYSFGQEVGCIYNGGGGAPIDPGVGQQGWLLDGMRRFADLVSDTLGVSTARAASASDVPWPYQFNPDCWIANPAKVNLFDTFARIPNAQWKGCVMARTQWNDRDVSDEAPNIADPDTLWVPWFWPDTPDQSRVNAEFPGKVSPNDYLADRLDLRDAQFPAFTDPYLLWGNYNWLKYNNTNANIDEVGPVTSGPNKACPDPILPLTNSRSTIEDKIAGLMHWNGSGTNTAEGISWGMRVLTPGAPFTEGSSDPKTQKVMVVMTDGVNNVDPSDDPWFMSHLSTYGALAHGRVQPQTFAGFRQHVNARMRKACELAKEQNIQIYTVAFAVSDPETVQLLQDCASKPPFAYSASTADDLVDAFRAIGTSLTELRISK
ncbi:MAG: pilus assembly protein TadG-related protein [Hyphomicrobiaceae bacterium]